MTQLDIVDEIKAEIRALGRNDAFQAGVIYGSAAKGWFTDDSDVDIILVPKDACAQKEVYRPIWRGVELDITVDSYGGIVRKCKDEAGRNRKPGLADAQVLFDNGGRLRALQEVIRKCERPRGYERSQYGHVEFEILYEEKKVRKLLNEKTGSAEYCMCVSLEALLEIYYRLYQRWWPGSKGAVYDIGLWDKELWTRIEQFVGEREREGRYESWCSIVEYIRRPVHGEWEKHRKKGIVDLVRRLNAQGAKIWDEVS